MDPRSVLIVTAETALARMLADGLAEQGWSAETAPGLAQALRGLDGDRHAAVVCDIVLRDGDGFELLAWLQARAHPIPVVLVSAFGAPDRSAAARAAGAFAHLATPFGIDELWQLLERAADPELDAADLPPAPRGSPAL